VIRIELTPRIRKTAAKLQVETRRKAETALAMLPKHFGNPHEHHGVGLRKLGRRSYEMRIDLRWRILLIHDSDGLIAYDIMSHDEIVSWLHGNNR
jgi:mRNA-degrading endonuclease RelE of RelBE toxin-antitoxin system